MLRSSIDYGMTGDILEGHLLGGYVRRGRSAGEQWGGMSRAGKIDGEC